ncbi:unnamed protein product [Sphagnum balticum]
MARVNIFECEATILSHVTMLYDWELYHSIFHNLDHGGRAYSINLFKVVLDMYDQHLSRSILQVTITALQTLCTFQN